MKSNRAHYLFLDESKEYEWISNESESIQWIEQNALSFSFQLSFEQTPFD